MKFFLLLCQLATLPWASSTSILKDEGLSFNRDKGPLETRQEKLPETSGIMSQKGIWAPKLAYATVFMMRHFVLLMLPSPFLKKEDVKAQSTKPGAQRTKLYYGPFTLPAMNPKYPTAGTSFNNRATQIPTDISLLRTEISLVNEDMTPAGIKDGISTRHIAFADTTQNPQFTYSCPSSMTQPSYPLSVFAGMTDHNEAMSYATPEGGVESGYYLPRGWALFLTSELVNYRDREKKIFIVLDMEYTPGKTSFFASPETVGLETCAAAGTLEVKGAVGQTKFEKRIGNITMAYDGYLLGLHGHMRDGGVETNIYLNEHLICNSRAQYGGGWQLEGSPPTLSGMTKCDRPIAVKANDALSVQAIYDYGLHPSSAPENGTAGIVGSAVFTFATKAGIF